MQLRPARTYHCIRASAWEAFLHLARIVEGADGPQQGNARSARSWDGSANCGLEQGGSEGGAAHSTTRASVAAPAVTAPPLSRPRLAFASVPIQGKLRVECLGAK